MGPHCGDKLLSGRLLGRQDECGGAVRQGLLDLVDDRVEGAWFVSPRSPAKAVRLGLNRSSPQRRADIAVDQVKQPQPMTT